MDAKKPLATILHEKASSNGVPAYLPNKIVTRLIRRITKMCWKGKYESTFSALNFWDTLFISSERRDALVDVRDLLVWRATAPSAALRLYEFLSRNGLYLKLYDNGRRMWTREFSIVLQEQPSKSVPASRIYLYTNGNRTNYYFEYLDGWVPFDHTPLRINEEGEEGTP